MSADTFKHMAMNVLYKNLRDSSFKDYYTLDEINQELNDVDGAEITFRSDKTNKEVKPKFHIKYTDYLQSIPSYRSESLPDNAELRVAKFITLSRV